MLTLHVTTYCLLIAYGINLELFCRFDNESLNYRDVGLLGNCDDQVALLADQLGWKEDLDALIEECSQATQPKL